MPGPPRCIVAAECSRSGSSSRGRAASRPPKTRPFASRKPSAGSRRCGRRRRAGAATTRSPSTTRSTRRAACSARCATPWRWSTRPSASVCRCASCRCATPRGKSRCTWSATCPSSRQPRSAAIGSRCASKGATRPPRTRASASCWWRSPSRSRRAGGSLVVQLSTSTRPTLAPPCSGSCRSSRIGRPRSCRGRSIGWLRAPCRTTSASRAHAAAGS
jgi:hypothetical protein